MVDKRMADAQAQQPVRQKPDRQKKVFIKTWGCQMNVYDSARMGDALETDGYAPTDSMEDADLVLLNTCHIREKAAEKVYSNLGRIRKLKEARAKTDRPLTIGVTGCVAQAEGEEIIARERAVDLVVGPQTYHRLPQILVDVATKGPQVVTDYFGGGQVRTPARRHEAAGRRAGRDRVPDRAGRLRQVLHLLRRALHAGSGGFPAPRANPHRSAGVGRCRGARNHAAGAERECLARGQPGWRGNGAWRSFARIGRSARHRPFALCHVAPQRHERRSDRSPPRPRRGDAIPAPARSGRVRPYSESHEPPSYRGALSRHHRPGSRSAA